MNSFQSAAGAFRYMELRNDPNALLYAADAAMPGSNDERVLLGMRIDIARKAVADAVPEAVAQAQERLDRLIEQRLLLLRKLYPEE